MNTSPVRCGLIGHPVAHSRSAEIHRAFAEENGIALDYMLLDVTPDEFATQVREFFATGGRGLNVTLPHKAAALALADEAGAEALRAGVANVLTQLPGGKLRADNTDGIGLARDLTRNLGFDLVDRRVLISGAGGAASGIVPALLDAGVHEIIITNRTAVCAQELAARLHDKRLSAASLAALSHSDVFDLVINATSASLEGERPNLPNTTVGPATLAYDLVYTDRATPFMNWASALGARTADGWGMLVEQAAVSFFIWHKIRPDSKLRIRRHDNTGKGS
ncbi:MAG: shikimate dehydrogenase [Gammaproteobacteria bacterium]